MRLAGKTIIVSGAGSGIGRAATRCFVDEGARVVGVDLSADGLAVTVDGVDRVSTVVVSVSEVDTWDRAIAAAASAGGPDGANLNAGLYGFAGPIDEHPLDVYQAIVDTNITGVVLGVRQCVPQLRSRGGGALVATASVAGIVAFEGNPIYTLTRQAVAGDVRAVAASLRDESDHDQRRLPGRCRHADDRRSDGGRLARSGIDREDHARTRCGDCSRSADDRSDRCVSRRARGWRPRRLAVPDLELAGA